MYRAEMLKLRTTRAVWVIAAVALGGMLVVQGFLVALPRVLDSLPTVTGQAAGLSADLAPALGALGDPSSPAFQRNVLDLLGSGGGGAGSTGVTAVCMLLLGALAVTTDFRTGGIVPTALVQPSRLRVLAGKAGATATVAAAIGVVLAVVSAAGLLVAIATTPDARLALSAGEVLGTWGRGLVVLVLLTWFGLGVGTLVRGQVATIVTIGALVLVEPLVRGAVALLSGGTSAATAWLPLGLGSLASAGPGAGALGAAPFGAAVALAGLVAWVVVLLGGGAASFARRDLV
jgi:ABC-2 type transport system permease protein